MTVTTLSGWELNQDIGHAKKAAKRGPMFITARGRPSHVLLSMEEYQRITSKHQSLVEALAMPVLSDIDFEPPRRHALPRPADFS
jgi:prevent-host-death family protein